MTDDIKAKVAETVARLRRQCDQSEALGDTPSDGAAWRIEAAGVLVRVAKAGFAAADLLEALAARLAEVKEERDLLMEAVQASMLRPDYLRAEAAEAEVARLRAAAGAAEERGIERAAVWLESVPQVLPDRQELASAIRKLKHTKDHPST